MIDSHCHFDLPVFDNKRQAILANAQKLGVTRLLVPGLTLDQFPQLMKLKGQFPCLDIALGCHPYFLKVLSKTELIEHAKMMQSLAQAHIELITAIGECGLDASIAIPIDYQEQMLCTQLRLAMALKKPIILHHRQSHNELIRILKREKFIGTGVVHAFSGSKQIAQAYISLGLALGVGGTITYARAIKTRNTIKAVGIEHILLETDAPDMPLDGFQGMPNTPERLPLVANALAQLKAMTVCDIVARTNQNYQRIFNS